MARSKVVGGSRLRRKLRRFEPELRSELAREMQAIGQEFEDELSARAPKDEGNLAEAAHHVVSSDKMGVAIGYSKDKPGFKRQWKRGGFVALFQEFGTSKHAAQPFIRDAWRAKVESALDRIDAARRRTVQRILRVS
jgi:HK97 gp10 family phage protein